MNQVLTPANANSFAGLNFITEEVKTGLFLALFGIGGSGKTSIAANIVKSKYGAPALLVSADKSYTSVTHLRSEGLDIIDVDSWQEIDKIKRALEKGDHKYKSVIWDNLSEILRLCIKRNAPSGMPEGSAALKTWGQITSQMMEFVAGIRILTVTQCMNVITVLWEETEKDELTQLIRYKVNLTPKLGAAFPGMVAMVGRLTVPGNANNGYIRKLDFSPSEKTDAKYRVAPTEAAAKIPMVLYLRGDNTFLKDFLSTVHDGTPFPVDKYGPPAK